MRVTKEYQPVKEQGRPVIIFGGRADVRVVAEARTDVAVGLDGPIWGFGMPRKCIGDYDQTMILVACGWWSALLHWGKTIIVRVPHGTEVEVRIARRIFTEGPLESPVIIDQGIRVE